MKRLAALLCCLAFLVPHVGFAATRPAIIGYLPTYKGNLAALLDKVDLHKLTQVNIAFLNPDPSGVIFKNGVLACGVETQAGPPPSADDVRAVVARAHKAGVKVVVSLGGAIIPACAGNWKTLLDPPMRAKTEASLLQFVHDFDLDGLDIDLEWQVLTSVDRAGDYVPFARDLSQALHKQGKVLSCATASEEGGMAPQASLPYFDYIGIMSYDAIGPGWGQAGDEQSSLADANRNIATWQARGARKDQIILGVPFYGYGFGKMPSRLDYRDILKTYGRSVAQVDVIGKRCAGCSYLTYNGRTTIQAKAALARQSAAGVMIWDITEDAPAPDSLLDALYSELNRSDVEGAG